MRIKAATYHGLAELLKHAWFVQGATGESATLCCETHRVTLCGGKVCAKVTIGLVEMRNGPKNQDYLESLTRNADLRWLTQHLR